MDSSGGCGASFDIVLCVSARFEGLTRLARHRLVMAVFEKELTDGTIHALAIKHLKTPEQYKSSKEEQ